jgi:Pyruvate/2-oxoacid:ferredoxin oxidoreductase gamma subunit
MEKEELVWMAGGAQGSGVDAAANIFGRACCYGGLHVYGKREYHSNIKGLHSYFHIRVSKNEVFADLDRVDLLCTFDGESVVRHIWEVAPEGGVICDKDALPIRINEIQPLTPPFKMEFNKILESKGIKAETVGDLVEARKADNVRTYAVPIYGFTQRSGRRNSRRKTEQTFNAPMDGCTCQCRGAGAIVGAGADMLVRPTGGVIAPISPSFTMKTANQIGWIPIAMAKGCNMGTATTAMVTVSIKQPRIK